MKAAPSDNTNPEVPITCLRRWNLVQRLNQDLWTAWRTIYLQSLEVRQKWHRPAKDVKVGEVVLIKDETLRVRNWPLARVIKIFPGTDGIIRAVDVRCSNHTYRRPVYMLVRLCADDTPPDDLQLNAEDQHSPPPSGCSGAIENFTRRLFLRMQAGCATLLHGRLSPPQRTQSCAHASCNDYFHTHNYIHSSVNPPSLYHRASLLK